MAMVRKKQDDKHLEALRELVTTGGGNRQCFDCGQKGPTYVNMTIGSFVCTRCSGVLRGITPPHRVKSISMATFTQDEIDFLRAHGNDICAKTWLGLWDPKRAVHQDQRELMIDKYERKRYYLEPASPLKSLTNTTNLKTTVAVTLSTSSTTATASSATNSQNNNNNNNKIQIQLTPPISQRTTANGLHKTSSTAISRPQHTAPHLQNGFSSSLSSHSTDAFGLHNGLNSSICSMSTGALSDTSSCTSANGFGAEADFVADFGSADIFNATVTSSPSSSIGSSATNNGYAKIQPMKISSAAHQQFMNGHGGGGGNKTSNLQNGNLVGNSNGNTENFADFDHAPIYNAADEQKVNYQFVRKNAIRKKSNSSISSGVMRRNERQLKDIMEMDNNDNFGDYINFNDDDIFDEIKSCRANSNCTVDYTNLFDDFDAVLTLNENRRHANAKEFESYYANVAIDNLGKVTKFTPLALAAHATAMAVLGSQNHFNSQYQTSETNNSTKLFTNQNDVWSPSSDVLSTAILAPALRFQNNNLTQHPYEMPQQQQQQQQQQQRQQQEPIYASIANFCTERQNRHQYFPSSTFSSQLLPQPSAATNKPKTFETGKTTISIPVASATTINSTNQIPTKRMLNKNTINTTNPFRMHLDVNDNYNTVNYDSDSYFNNDNTTAISPTRTSATSTCTENSDFNQNFNNDFSFISNAILSCHSDLFPITTTITTTTSKAIQNYNTNDEYYNNNNTKFDCSKNSRLYYTKPNNGDYNDDNDNNHNDDDDDDDFDVKNHKNPFLNAPINSKNVQNLFNTHKSTNHPSSASATSSIPTCNSTATAFLSSTVKSQRNPFYPAASDCTYSQFSHNVVDNDNGANIANFRNVDESKNCYYSINCNCNCNCNCDGEHCTTACVDVDNRSCRITNSNHFNGKFNPKNFNYISYLNAIATATATATATTNANATAAATANAKANDQNRNNNENYNTKNNNNNNNNNNTNTNSWRLPINNNKNNNNNKNFTTNGFNNNNNINNNNNSSAPAEDRYAALKDLDQQLRESKAVAAQAAAIVTANVVDQLDSSFGNPNGNATVNPFATQHQQTAVVNPFQNASNNPTQNTTQQLFGQMTLIPNGVAAANGFLNAQKTHTANTGFFNYTASGFTNGANTPQMQQHQQHQPAVLYPAAIQGGLNGCGFGIGTLQQQITSTGTGLTTNTFNNPFAATGALNSNNPFL